MPCVLLQVKDIDTYINWLNGTFVEQFFFSKYFGAEYSEGTYKSFTRDIANLRVGPARLRQLRISRGGFIFFSCVPDRKFRVIDGFCLFVQFEMI